MGRQEYSQCMIPYMKGTGLSKEDRQKKFCVGAKICSGKAKDESSALVLCSQPKPEKLRSVSRRKSSKSRSCEDDALALAECMVENIDMNLASNINSIGAALANSLIACRCDRGD